MTDQNLPVAEDAEIEDIVAIDDEATDAETVDDESDESDDEDDSDDAEENGEAAHEDAA